MQTQHVEGSTVVIRVDGREERHKFQTREEAERRVAFVDELLTWIGTPFVDCGAVKGPRGAVDCAKMLWKAAMVSGIIHDVPEPRYAARIIRSHEESFLAFLTFMGATEIQSPRVGDVLVYMWPTTFKHGAVLINSEQIIHSYAAAGCVKISHTREDLLSFFPRANIPRPVRYFNVWNP